MKKAVKYLLDIGINEDMPLYEQHKIRFTNTLGLSVLVLELFYLAVGLIIGSFYLSLFCILLFVMGVLGTWMNALKKYELSKTLFLRSFSIALFLFCNTLSNGQDFAVLYFPHVIAYGVYYDLDGKQKSLFINLAFTLTSIVCFFLMPHYLIGKESMSAGWVSFFKQFNLLVALQTTGMFIFFTLKHSNESSKELKQNWKEAVDRRKELVEEKKRAEEATLAKSQFLSNMSHELRTPLNGIIGTVHLLLQEDMLETQNQHFKVLKYSSEHMLSLVNEVLDFSKIEAGQMEIAQAPFNLKLQLNKLYSVFEHQFAEKHIELQFEMDPALDRIFTGDETRLNQVLSNLISNALKFTRRGQVQCVFKVVTGQSQSAEILFSIKDTGIGISKKNQEKIFEAFRQGESSTTRRYGGTGLGLSISKKIVDLMGGELRVESELGKGSCFSFVVSLPIHQHQRTYANAGKFNELKSLEGIRVLLADDSSVNRKITRSFLEKWKVEMDEAADGREAVHLFLKNKYDLLLIDLHMPVMDGYQAIASIRELNKQIPSIAFTAAIMPDMAAKLLENGFTDYVQKPFRPEDLHRKIVAYCRAERVKG